MPNKKDDVYGDHISARFNDELNELKTQFLNMGGMVESQVEQAIQALVESDGQLAEKVRLGDKQVDKMELDLVGDEAKKIAKMAIKLTEEGQAPRGYVEIRHIGTHVLSMLHDALDAFARLDSEQALRIMKEDKQVDEEYQAAARALLTFMMEDTRNITRCMMVMWVLRAFERIGDHACNIAEHVIFMAKGEDIRHSPMEEAERVVGR